MDGARQGFFSNLCKSVAGGWRGFAENIRRPSSLLLYQAISNWPLQLYKYGDRTVIR